MYKRQTDRHNTEVILAQGAVMLRGLAEVYVTRCERERVCETENVWMNPLNSVVVFEVEQKGPVQQQVLQQHVTVTPAS